eukprot:jgi/Picsp_1/749/NSC_04238-R1_---NA---
MEARDVARQATYVANTVLELRDSIKDQIFTVECMHEVMREQQRALCSSSNQGLLSNSVEHGMVPLTSQKDCSFYLSKTKEFQLKSEVLVSKIWNVLRAYEASLSGSSSSGKQVLKTSTDDTFEDSCLSNLYAERSSLHVYITSLDTSHPDLCAGSGHPESLENAAVSEQNATIKGNERFEKYLNTNPEKNASEFHEKRAEFWESLAKCSINVLNTMSDGEHALNQTAKYSDSKDTVTIKRENLNTFSNQISDLSDDVQRLKKRSQDDGCHIQKLKEQNDRFHKALCARKEKIRRLEDCLAKEKTRNERSSYTDESKELQAVIAQLRLSVETHRDRFLKAAAEKDVLKGHNEELMERVRRREDALKKAQDRCRTLESKISGIKTTSECHSKSSYKLNSSRCAIQQAVYQDASTCMPPSKSQLALEALEESAEDACSEELSKIESYGLTIRKQDCIYVKDGSDFIASLHAVDSLQPECHSVVSLEAELAQSSHNEEKDSDTDENTREGNFDKTKSHEPCAPSAHNEENYEHDKALSNDPDMGTIRAALAKADDTILSCMQRIETLQKILNASQDEAAKSQQMYASNLEELDTASRSLHASQSLVLQLQKQLSDVQEASAAYHHQMDQMFMSEREDFAKESHLLSSQVHDLSNKLVCSQAKFLHKIQTARKELEKAQAINRQLSTQIAQKEKVIQTYAMALGERKIKSLGSEPIETVHSTVFISDHQLEKIDRISS